MPNYEIPGDVDINRGLVGYLSLDNLKEIPSDGIIAHYKMNDNAADTVVIDSKGGNTGTAARNTADFTTASGKIGRALDFNGSSDEIDLGTDIDLPNNMTVCFWMNTAATVSGEEEIISKLVGGSGNNIQFECGIETSDN
ncbi:MAG: hypothetical protein QQN41_13920, partial [Nitrosopumilus sp.]